MCIRDSIGAVCRLQYKGFCFCIISCCHLASSCLSFFRYYFPPVMATPSMNCFWKNRYRTTMGIIASREPAIITGKLVLNCPLTVSYTHLYAKEAPAHRFLMDERGWDTLLTHNGVNVILLLFLLALCVPIFCGEYQCGMAQILHSCRNGRSRLVCYPDYTALHPVPADGADYIFRHHGFYPATFDRRQLSQICPSAPGRSAGRNRLCVGNTDRGWI